MRKPFAALIALTLLIAACGGGDDSDTTPTESASTGSESASSTAAPETEEAAPEPEPEATDEPEPDPEPEEPEPEPTTRVVEHPFGSTEVPFRPERVYVGGPDALDVAIALGVPLVGGAQWRSDLSLPSYMQAVGGDVPTPTDPDEPNLELIATLQPDLILIPNFEAATQYELFSQIAPTVVFGGVDQSTFERESWPELLAEIAAYTNTEDAVADVLATYDADIARLQDALVASGFDGAEVAMLRPTGETEFRLYRPIGQSAGDTIWVDAGLPYQTVPDTLVDNGIYATLSAERVDLVTSELVFIVLPEGFAPFAQAELDNSLVWQASPALTDGEVCLIDRESSEQAWLNVGPLATGHIIDDIVACLEG